MFEFMKIPFRILGAVGVLIWHVVPHFLSRGKVADPPYNEFGMNLHFSPTKWFDKFVAIRHETGSSHVRVQADYPHLDLRTHVSGAHPGEMINESYVASMDTCLLMAYGPTDKGDSPWCERWVLEYLIPVLSSTRSNVRYVELWNEPDKWPIGIAYTAFFEKICALAGEQRRRKFIPAATLNFVQDGWQKLKLNISILKEFRRLDTVRRLGTSPTYNVHFYGTEIHKLIVYGAIIKAYAKLAGFDKIAITEFGNSKKSQRRFQIQVMLPIAKFILGADDVYWYNWDVNKHAYLEK
jgi:hypothetical protein